MTKHRRYPKPRFRLVRYRNQQGYVIEKDYMAKTSVITAAYVRCPLNDGLLSIDHCNGCQFFAQICERGIDCKNRTPYRNTIGWEDPEKTKKTITIKTPTF